MSRYSNYALNCYNCYKYYDYESLLCFHDNRHDNRGGDNNDYYDKHQWPLPQKQHNKGDDMHKYKGDSRAHKRVNRHIAPRVLIQQ